MTAVSSNRPCPSDRPVATKTIFPASRDQQVMPTPGENQRAPRPSAAPTAVWPWFRGTSPPCSESRRSAHSGKRYPDHMDPRIARGCRDSVFESPLEHKISRRNTQAHALPVTTAGRSRPSDTPSDTSRLLSGHHQPNTAVANRSAAARCMVGTTSSMIEMLACGSRSCTTLGCPPAGRSAVACVCLMSCSRITGARRRETPAGLGAPARRTTERTIPDYESCRRHPAA